MMKWLYKRNKTYIDGFDFKKLPKTDKGEEANRRNTFTDAEVERIVKALDGCIKTAEKDLKGEGNVQKAVGGYYLGVSLISGLRRGEQLQLRWTDIDNDLGYREEGRNMDYRQEVDGLGTLFPSLSLLLISSFTINLCLWSMRRSSLC